MIVCRRKGTPTPGGDGGLRFELTFSPTGHETLAMLERYNTIGVDGPHAAMSRMVETKR